MCQPFRGSLTEGCLQMEQFVSYMPGRSHSQPLIVFAVCIFMLSGCGSDGGRAAESSPAGTAQTTADPAGPHGGGEPKLNGSVCKRLQPTVATAASRAGSRGSPLKVHSSGTPTLSTCTYGAKDVTVSISLDTATESNQRFANRTVEAIQFADSDPAALPQNVPGVGDPKAEYDGAVWISNRAQFLAIRGDRLVIIGFYVAGAPDRLLKDGAAEVARRTYVITPSSTS